MKPGLSSGKAKQTETGGDLQVAELEALLDAAVDAIIVIDDHGIIERFNKAAEVLFGYDANEVCGKSLNVLMPVLPDGENHDNYLSTYLRTGVAKIIGTGRDLVAKKRDGSTFPMNLSVGEARLGDQLRFVGIMHDLTDQKRAEEEALRSREQMMHVSRLTTMGEMAAAMAHELNQPLAAIANYTAACQRLIGQGSKHRKDVEDALEAIGNQAHRAGEVIQRLRNFTRDQELSRSSLSISSILEEIRPLAQLDAKANNILMVEKVAEDLPPVVADRVQIQSVVLNLLRNGVDAMAGTPPDQRQLELTVDQISPESIRISIRDRGTGVSDKVRSNLFNPFFTTKKQGMGMGLAICRSIVVAHGGKLECFNNEDGGATFWFTVPTEVLS